MTCSWCHHVHQYPVNAPDFGTCAPDGFLQDGTRCECAGEESMGKFPDHPVEQKTKQKKTFFEVIKQVSEESQMSSWGGTLVDSFSANAAMAVYNALRDDLKEKFITIINFRAEKYGPGAAMSTCVWKFIKR